MAGIPSIFRGGGAAGSASIFRGGLAAGSSSIYRIEGETPTPVGELTWDEIPGNWDEVPGNFDEAGQP